MESWEVSAAPEMTQWTDPLVQHRLPGGQGGQLTRPVPLSAVGALGLAAAGTGSRLGWTPPYWTPATQGAALAVGTDAKKLL